MYTASVLAPAFVSAAEFEPIPEYIAQLKEPAPHPTAETNIMGHTIEASGGFDVVLGNAYPEVAQQLGNGNGWSVATLQMPLRRSSGTQPPNLSYPWRRCKRCRIQPRYRCSKRQ